MKVLKIVDEGDRLLLYGKDPSFHVIARPTDTVKVGDSIAYEPYGVNFGFTSAP